MKILITICVVLATAQGLACSDIRLDTIGVLANSPVFDQANSSGTDMNICYAATAAELIDTYRASRPEDAATKEYTSPWWTAVSYSSVFKNEPDPDVQFGEPDKALETLKTDGVCSQSDLFENKPTEEIIRFHQSLKEFYQTLSEDNDTDKNYSRKLAHLLEKGHFLKDASLLAEISTKAVQEKSFVHFLRSIFHGKCQGKIKSNSPFEIDRIDAQRLNLSNEKKQFIVTQTLEKAQPIEVSICSQVLSNPGYQPLENFKKCLRHSVLLVGSRKHNGQCQYLVRDNYGPDSCKRKRRGEPWYHPSLECQNGQVWVPEQALLKNTWGMTRVFASTQLQNTPTAVAAPAPEVSKSSAGRTVH